MKQRVSDYIADFLAENGITDCFTVTGGGAMFLNDSFGHHNKIHSTYCHHEQAAAMAAEAYARIDNKPALLCVTTGPGATNAITGVAGGWMDSIPMIVISGQVRYATSVYSTGLKLRTRGVQEFDIIGSVQNMTKYCELVKDPTKIRYCLEKALHLAKNERPGPCWLDIPLDVQGAEIETDGLEGYTCEKTDYTISKSDIEKIISKLNEAERPLIFIGNGVRLGNAHDDCLKFINKSGIPAVSGMSSVDAMAENHPFFIGRSGTTGQRAANFAVQNCDLLLSLGSRQSFFQTGFTTDKWADKAYKILNDIDGEELKRPDLPCDMAVVGDVKSLLEQLNAEYQPQPEKYSDWVNTCNKWKKKYPVVQDKHYNDTHANIYAFYKEMTELLPADVDIVVSAGTSRVAGSQAAVIKEGQRFIANPAMASMGYDLPPAVGVAVASKRKTVLITGDGGFQMNIQELQTIKQNKLPIIIFIMNNQGYHSIRMTQKNFFSGNK
ncbi:MAG: thiamine pyrophosphate-binding protein, partial [Ruminococcus sp.]|nr:thiamine pyrophosphate-binding protein [Ruminococcus sp.]